MRNRHGSVAIEPDHRNDPHRSVVPDLVALIEHVHTSLRLIEQEIARETELGSQETAANVIVLDDVTPTYVHATAALNACGANLALALRSLLDSKSPAHEDGELSLAHDGAFGHPRVSG